MNNMHYLSDKIPDIKILAIGNSFSVDAMTYLYDIARAEGIENVVIGNLYIGGCTLETHYNNTVTGDKAYVYYKNTDGIWRETPSYSILDGIEDEEWDIITMQQGSGSSGLPETYSPYLEGLIDYVKSHMRNPDCVLGWHMTWSYQSSSDHPEFVKYVNSQSAMDDAIRDALEKKVLPTNAFRLVIPSGEAIKYARRSALGDNLNRDGFHLNELGRYIAGYTWLRTIVGQPLSALAFKPQELKIEGETETLIVNVVNSVVQNA